MTLILTLGHLFALAMGAIAAAILMAVLSSARVQEARARAKIQEARADCRGLRLAEFQGHYNTLQVHHRETLELEHEIHAHLKKREADARTIAILQKAFNEQLHDEIRTLNQALGKIPELHSELAEWAGLGQRLQSWLAGSDGQVEEDRGRLPAPQFRELEGLLSDLDVLLRGSDLDSPQFTSIEETTSDEKAGPAREVAAVEA
jgi:hypothetical protein